MPQGGSLGDRPLRPARPLLVCVAAGLLSWQRVKGFRLGRPAAPAVPATARRRRRRFYRPWRAPAGGAVDGSKGCRSLPKLLPVGRQCTHLPARRAAQAVKQTAGNMHACASTAQGHMHQSRRAGRSRQQELQVAGGMWRSSGSRTCGLLWAAPVGGCCPWPLPAAARLLPPRRPCCAVHLLPPLPPLRAAVAREAPAACQVPAARQAPVAREVPGVPQLCRRASTGCCSSSSPAPAALLLAAAICEVCFLLPLCSGEHSCYPGAIRGCFRSLRQMPQDGPAGPYWAMFRQRC